MSKIAKLTVDARSGLGLVQVLLGMVALGLLAVAASKLMTTSLRGVSQFSSRGAGVDLLTRYRSALLNRKAMERTSAASAAGSGAKQVLSQCLAGAVCPAADFPIELVDAADEVLIPISASAVSLSSTGVSPCPASGANRCAWSVTAKARKLDASNGTYRFTIVLSSIPQMGETPLAPTTIVQDVGRDMLLTGTQQCPAGQFLTGYDIGGNMLCQKGLSLGEVCADGTYLRGVDADGNLVCEIDLVGGGVAPPVAQCTIYYMKGSTCINASNKCGAEFVGGSCVNAGTDKKVTCKRCS